jgi:hypothetical protein
MPQQMPARLPAAARSEMSAGLPEGSSGKVDRILLDVLRAELNYLERGGYSDSLRAPWRPSFFFEDSSSCPNSQSRQHPAPCSECVLVELVPSEARAEQIACRHILLTPCGESLESLYRTGTHQEIEGALAAWLRATIQSLETERGLEHTGVTAQVSDASPNAIG